VIGKNLENFVKQGGRKILVNKKLNISGQREKAGITPKNCKKELMCCDYTGYSGHVQISNNADRLGEYSLWHKPRPGSAIYERLLILKMTSFQNKLGLGASNIFRNT